MRHDVGDPLDLYGEAVTEAPVVTAGTRAKAPRNVGIDALRGGAILYMILSHVLRASGMWWPGGLGYAAFAYAGGLVWRPLAGWYRWRRFGALVVAAVLSAGWAPVIGLNGWTVIASWVVVWPVRSLMMWAGVPTWVRCSIWLGVFVWGFWMLWFVSAPPGLLGLVVEVADGRRFEVTEWWRGRLASRSGRLLQRIGRRPLRWWLGHLVVLILVFGPQ